MRSDGARRSASNHGNAVAVLVIIKYAVVNRNADAVRHSDIHYCDCSVICFPESFTSGGRYFSAEEMCFVTAFQGFLINSKPENACEPIAPPPLKDNSSTAFIVLIRRLECNFDIKVLNAQRAGYKAAIVHNVDSDDLISMGSNDIEILKKIDIPSVFIGEASANSLKEEFTYEKGGHVVLIPEFSLPLEYYLIPFLIIVGICLILIVIFMEMNMTCVPFAWMSMRMETSSESFRVLTGDSDSETDSSQEENEVSENTPLLRPLASVSTQSFGALSESHSHQNVTESSEYEEDDNDNTDSSDAENGVNEESVIVQLQPNDERDYRVTNTV
ncbi:hypothetical protein ASZ78_013597 [Callipepla squamata]|uniref:PA domain-containing protein n=1 Tax=Callipepla squamata TaxID=9009 RepID=A0A226MP99_CALSU|nr:hypothetical protein ASZ78_013597 [Callipepla squamata]